MGTDGHPERPRKRSPLGQPWVFALPESAGGKTTIFDNPDLPSLTSSRIAWLMGVDRQPEYAQSNVEC